MLSVNVTVAGTTTDPAVPSLSPWRAVKRSLAVKASKVKVGTTPSTSPSVEKVLVPESPKVLVAVSREEQCDDDEGVVVEEG
jgi:hypothetical protein